jgi:hypothetical protein
MRRVPFAPFHMIFETKTIPICASKLHTFAPFSNTHLCKTTAHLNFLSKFVYLFRLRDFVCCKCSHVRSSLIFVPNPTDISFPRYLSWLVLPSQVKQKVKFLLISSWLWCNIWNVSNLDVVNSLYLSNGIQKYKNRRMRRIKCVHPIIHVHTESWGAQGFYESSMKIQVR